jgi:alkyldihydroxyacetonephosphate synthase
MWDLFHSELTDIVGENHVFTSEADKLAYSSDVFWVPNLWIDRKKDPLKPDYIVQPGSVDEVKRVMALANREKIPVTPWGGGSGSQGGILPVYGGIMLDMKRLNRIIEIDEVSHTVTVEAGINCTLLELALNEKGLTFPHYAASSNCASVGGFIAHRGSGTLSTKYGKIEDFVLSMEVLLPSGKIIKTLPVPKHASGPGLHELFIGCEGTFAIVTKATLQIYDMPQERRFAAYLFNTLEDGIEAGRRMMSQGIGMNAIRLYDPGSTKTKVGDVLGVKFDNDDASYMVIGYDGFSEMIDVQEKLTNRIVDDLGGQHLGREGGERWWNSRYHFYYPPYEFRLPWMYGTMDTVCMYKDIARLYRAKKDAIELNFKDLGIRYIAHFSHWYKWGVMVYDRFIIEEPPEDPQEAIRLHNEIWNLSVRTSLANGGVINEHHGIGLKLGRFVVEEYGEDGFEFLKQLKGVVDPNGILNPGKMGFGPGALR